MTRRIDTLHDLTGKVAVVSGGAGLIGATLCEILAEAGATVVMVDCDADLAARRPAESYSLSIFFSSGAMASAQTS